MRAPVANPASNGTVFRYVTLSLAKPVPEAGAGSHARPKAPAARSPAIRRLIGPSIRRRVAPSYQGEQGIARIARIVPLTPTSQEAPMKKLLLLALVSLTLVSAGLPAAAGPTQGGYTSDNVE